MSALASDPLGGRLPMAMWKKTLRLLPIYAWLSLLRISEFKFNFYTYVFLYFANAMLFVLCWQGIKLDGLGKWDSTHCILLTAFSILNFGLQESLWSTAHLDRFIMDGELLRVLTKPINSYFGLVMRYFAFMSLLPVILGISMIVYTMIHYRLDVELWRLAISLWVCVLGAVSFRAALVVMGSFAFRLGMVGFLTSYFHGSRETTRLPMTHLPSFISGFYTFAIPAVLVSTWPVIILDLGSTWQVLLLSLSSLAVCAFWVLLAKWTWTRGVRRYEGIGRW